MDQAAIDRAYARVMARTRPEGICIVFTGAKDGHGYGSIRVGRHVMNVHRLAWIHRHGEPAPGLEVMHTCDNPPCVADEHHVLGTHLENLLDCVAKGRARRRPLRGAESPCARLTTEQVAEIRERRGIESQRALGARFGVSQVQVGRIQRGEAWAS